jgi:hypothetical protein
MRSAAKSKSRPPECENFRGSSARSGDFVYSSEGELAARTGASASRCYARLRDRVPCVRAFHFVSRSERFSRTIAQLLQLDISDRGKLVGRVLSEALPNLS